MAAGAAIATILLIIWSSPRQFGRLLAKIRIGYLAQMKDEGHDP